ncbi:MAG TPA: hypothetical protein VIT67_15715, partial [Povalibacter sp.]
LVERQRIGRDASEADVSVMERQKGYWETFAAEETDFVIDVDTGNLVAVERALARLSYYATR